MNIFFEIIAVAFIVILFLFAVGSAHLNYKYDRDTEREFFGK